jgi:hypothetical protein
MMIKPLHSFFIKMLKLSFDARTFFLTFTNGVCNFFKKCKIIIGLSLYINNNFSTFLAHNYLHLFGDQHFLIY